MQQQLSRVAKASIIIHNRAKGVFLSTGFPMGLLIAISSMNGLLLVKNFTIRMVNDQWLDFLTTVFFMNNQ